MENGDLEKQPEPLDTVMISDDAGLTTAEPAETESTASNRVATETVAASSEPAAKEPLWQRLRQQPRETAAIVILVVTAIIWLDSGDSSSPRSQSSKPIDPMDGFESYLSDSETGESGTPLRGSADPVDTQSPASFGGELLIPQSPQSEFASTVTANYCDSMFEPSNSLSNSRDTATTAAQYPADADAYGAPAYRTNAVGAGLDMNDSDSQQNRRVRFAGRIRPAN